MLLRKTKTLATCPGPAHYLSALNEPSRSFLSGWPTSTCSFSRRTLLHGVSYRAIGQLHILAAVPSAKETLASTEEAAPCPVGTASFLGESGGKIGKLTTHLSLMLRCTICRGYLHVSISLWQQRQNLTSATDVESLNHRLTKDKWTGYCIRDCFKTTPVPKSDICKRFYWLSSVFPELQDVIQQTTICRRRVQNVSTSTSHYEK
jgi:hypothetical protein